MLLRCACRRATCSSINALSLHMQKRFHRSSD
jgi:hypothetical protein